jgi:signal transduction histidine kinase
MFVQAQYQQQHITITSDLCATGWVLGNPYRLEQVILNILSNSRDAIEAKYSGIESAFQTGEIHIKTYSDKEQTIIEIADTGSGMSEEVVDHIFDPFFTTKPTGQGTGLGLSVSYGIIKNKHGDMTVKSQPGEGTVFTIKLPRIE